MKMKADVLRVDPRLPRSPRHSMSHNGGFPRRSAFGRPLAKVAAVAPPATTSTRKLQRKHGEHCLPHAADPKNSSDEPHRLPGSFWRGLPSQPLPSNHSEGIPTGKRLYSRLHPLVHTCTFFGAPSIAFGRFNEFERKGKRVFEDHVCDNAYVEFFIDSRNTNP